MKIQTRRHSPSWEEYGFDLNQVMAFGHSDNDLEMLAGVGMSVAMGNGSSVPKELLNTLQQAINKMASTRP